MLRDNIPKVPKNPRGGKLENDPDVKQPHSEFYTDIIFARFVKKNGTDLRIFICFILRFLRKITDFWGKILKHIRIIRKITYDLQIKFDRMLSVFLLNVKNQKK